MIEIQVGPVSAILGLYLVALVLGRRRPAAAILAFGLGAAVPAAILLGYNDLAFGSPWKMGYFFLVTERFKEVHSASNPLGLARPDWSKLAELALGGATRAGPLRADRRADDPGISRPGGPAALGAWRSSPA